MRKKRKIFSVRDRATLFNLLIGLNGYTVCSGVIDKELNGANIIAVPLEGNENMRIRIYYPQKIRFKAHMGKIYVEALKKYIGK